MPWLNWSLAGAAAIHIFEEFVFPGGFKTWYLAYRPEIAASVSDRFLIGINALLLAAAAAVALALYAPHGNGVAAWLALAALLFSNAVFHIVGAIQTRRYSPGMVSGAVIYMPLAIYGFIHFRANGQASAGTALVAAVLGGSYYFVSYFNHRRRALARHNEVG